MVDYKQRKKEFNQSEGRLKKIESSIITKQVKKKIVQIDNEESDNGPKKKVIPILVHDPMKTKGPTPHMIHLGKHINERPMKKGEIA